MCGSGLGKVVQVTSAKADPVGETAPPVVRQLREDVPLLSQQRCKDFMQMHSIVHEVFASLLGKQRHILTNSLQKAALQPKTSGWRVCGTCACLQSVTWQTSWVAATL